MILQHTEKLPFIVSLSQAHHYGSEFILSWKKYSLSMRIIVFLGIWSQTTNFLKQNVWLRKAKKTKLTRVLLYSKKRKPILQSNVKPLISVLFVSSALDTCPAHIKIIGWKWYLTKMHLPICLKNKFVL